MSILKNIDIDLDPIVADAKALAGRAVDFLADVPIMAVQKAVAFIKETSLGTAIANLISAASHVDDPGVSGIDKFNAVFDAARAAYDAFVENGALDGLIDLGTSVLRQTIQALYDHLKSTFGFA